MTTTSCPSVSQYFNAELAQIPTFRAIHRTKAPVNTRQPSYSDHIILQASGGFFELKGDDAMIEEIMQPIRNQLKGDVPVSKEMMQVAHGHARAVDNPQGVAMNGELVMQGLQLQGPAQGVNRLLHEQNGDPDGTPSSTFLHGIPPQIQQCRYIQPKETNDSTTEELRKWGWAALNHPVLPFVSGPEVVAFLQEVEAQAQYSVPSRYRCLPYPNEPFAPSEKKKHPPSPASKSGIGEIVYVWEKQGKSVILIEGESKLPSVLREEDFRGLDEYLVAHGGTRVYQVLCEGQSGVKPVTVSGIKGHGKWAPVATQVSLLLR
ncbi:hypothetical protein IAR55_006783 [Kwoniella newhampshirensis]|uniref:Uncharacterized protein n=1 Tax=Kwoniella newhampshirensis TaxID=1651941 RepID=A0AAW0YEG0_9TREE